MKGFLLSIHEILVHSSSLLNSQSYSSRVTLVEMEKTVELVFKEKRVLRVMLALWEFEGCL